ncbi:hypothetical protein M427DRAFT_165645 [Gonapodya prolifera JEL478]|uniref:Uncharacterized protein n=1 Tax=Gonapodya prolifera (strain JEL478) TaxID=1344416 RepID=A0A139AZI3_GONPJ|nr:hypothetical protein M427DRAFT_165645 [Gonapodya prolifera JEL478]|eukprot:KXS22129.1 hypothetical protein M427DRAFT_165645 [Gonapodya prolifera JEL478]
MFPLEFKGPKVWGFSLYGRPSAKLMRAYRDKEDKLSKERQPNLAKESTASKITSFPGLSLVDSAFVRALKTIPSSLDHKIAFMLHLLYIKALPLHQRSLQSVTDLDHGAITFMQQMHTQMSAMLPQLTAERIVDLFDGRLYATMVEEVRRDGGELAARELDGEAGKHLNIMLEMLGEEAMPPHTFEGGQNSNTLKANSPPPVDVGLTPIDNDLVKQIHAAVDPQLAHTVYKTNQSMVSDYRYTAKSHWHVLKPLKDPLDRMPSKHPKRVEAPMGQRPMTEARRMALENKRRQVYYKFLRNYAESLSGSAQLHHHIILRQSDGPTNSTKKKLSSKALQIIERNKIEMMKKAEATARSQVDFLFAQTADFDAPQKVLSYIISGSFMQAIGALPAAVGAEAQAKRIQVLFRVFRDVGKWEAEDDFAVQTVSQMFRAVWEIQRNYVDRPVGVSSSVDWHSIWGDVSSIMRRIGFPDAEASLKDFTSSSGLEIATGKASTTRAPSTAVHFQLSQMEEALERDLERVSTHFICFDHKENFD